MPCRFASSGTVATSRSASRAILALNVASNFLRDLVISVLRRLRQSRTLHTLTFGPISGVHFTRHDYYANNKDVLSGIIRGWADANDYILRNSTAAAEALQKNHYSHASAADITEALKAQKMFSSREWKRLYSDGTVVKWLQQVSDFFMADAGVTNSTRASEYFDPSLYLAAIP